jgi:hypothetical protein
VALYAKQLLLDQFDLLNDSWQVMLEEIKELKDERAQKTNQSHPNQHADSMESTGTSIKTYIVSGNLKLMKG